MILALLYHLSNPSEAKLKRGKDQQSFCHFNPTLTTCSVATPLDGDDGWSKNIAKLVLFYRRDIKQMMKILG